MPENDPELYVGWRRVLVKKTYDTGVARAQAVRFIRDLESSTFDDITDRGSDDPVQEALDAALDIMQQAGRVLCAVHQALDAIE